MTFDLNTYAETLKTRLVDEIREGAPRRTGKFADSIEGALTSTGSGVEIDITGDGIPGAFLIRGTRAHPVAPVNKLALFWEGAEHPIRRAVQIPAHEPNHWVDDIAEREAERAVQELADGLVAAWSTGI